jgi:TonB family protein
MGNPRQHVVSVLVASLAAAVTVAMTAGVSRAQSPPPTHESYTLGSSLVERLASPANGIVWRISPEIIPKCDPDLPSEDPIIRCHRVISGTPIRITPWFRSLASILTDLGSFETSDAPLAFAPEIAISFGPPDSSTQLLIDFARSLVEITPDGLPTITGTLTDPTLKLAHLVGEALPEDGESQAPVSRAEANLRRIVETSETIGPFWPDCSGATDPGDFVSYDEVPIPIQKPQPPYPPGTTADAKVIVHAFVSAEGKVCFVRMIHGIEPFAEYALEAARQWTFEPASTHGTRVGVWVELPFDFLFSGQQARRDPRLRYEEPAPMTKVVPNYPEFAKEAQIEGRVVINARIDEEGRVVDVRIKEGVIGLNEAAVDALKPTKFRPATMNGKPVSAWLEVPIDFHR